MLRTPTKIVSAAVRGLIAAALLATSMLQPAAAYNLSDALLHEALHYGEKAVAQHTKATYGSHHSGSSAAAVPVAGMSATYGTPNGECPQFQVHGYPAAPATIQARSYFTCRAGYAGMYDAGARTPVWSAEHLSKSTVRGSAKRNGIEFGEDPQIPMTHQGQLSDYRGSGFDRGHLSPAGDFHYSDEALRQSFLLSNVVPQDKVHNEHIWANLEAAVREMTDRRGDLYVVTGPVFSGNVEWLSHGRKNGSSGIPIPTALFKVIVDPARGEMTAFVIPNRSDVGEDPAPYQVSVREVERLTGLNFNPQLSRSDADRQEVGGGNWMLPSVRVRFRD